MNQPVRDIQQAELPNGVVIVTEKMPHVRSVSVGIWLGTGSRAESPERNGIAHFIEHMVFKGTRGARPRKSRSRWTRSAECSTRSRPRR